MVWNIMHDVDLETAKATSLENRVTKAKNSFPVQFFERKVDSFMLFPPGSLLGIVRAVGRPIFSWNRPQTSQPVGQKYFLFF